MKNLIHDISIQIDEGKINTAPKGTKKPLTAKAMPNDPNDPNVLVRGFGVMRKSQAEKTGMTYEPYKSVVKEEVQLDEISTASFPSILKKIKNSHGEGFEVGDVVYHNKSKTKITYDYGDGTYRIYAIDPRGEKNWKKVNGRELIAEGAAAENPMSTYGMKGQSAQSMAGSMHRGPTQQEMIKAQKHMEKEHDPGHKMIGLTVGLDGKAQVKSAITQTSVVGEPVKKPAVKEETELDEMNNSGLHPGWMLKKDPALAKKVNDATSGYKDLKKYAGKKIEPKEVKEAVETKIQMTMPLFIRLLEWAREECKSDEEIHHVAENLAAVNGVADMDNYKSLLEETDLIEHEDKWEKDHYGNEIGWGFKQDKKEAKKYSNKSEIKSPEDITKQALNILTKSKLVKEDTLNESPQAWEKTAYYAAKELPNEVINAALAAFGTGDHEENKKSIKRSQKLQNVLQRSIRLMSRKRKLDEMTNVKKMNSHHKNGYIDGIMGHPRTDSGEHQKEYDAAFRLGTIHRNKLKRAKVKL